MRAGWRGPVAAVCLVALFAAGCFRGPLPDLEDGSVGERSVAALSSAPEAPERLGLAEIASRLVRAEEAISVGEPIARGSHDLLPVTVRSADALAAWRALRDRLRGTGWWPVVVGAPAAIEEVRAQVADYETDPVAEILERAAGFRPSSWARERRSDFRGTLKDYRSAWFTLSPRDPPNRELSVHYDYTAEEGSVVPHEILVMLIPTAFGWEAPAYLGFGGFNDCPSAEVLVAFLYRWHQAVGAEVASIGWSVLELVVPDPVGDERLALDLARERFYVCPDQIFQGFRDLDHLASTIRRDEVWSLWWD